MSDDPFFVTVIGANRLNSFDRQPEVVRKILLDKVAVLTEKLAQVAGRLMSERLKSKTGRLTPSDIQTEVNEVGGGVVGRVFIQGVPYARIQEEGGQTSPHIIYPKNSKVLAFIGATGDKVIASRVFHPGGHIPGQHFFKDAYRQMGPEISRSLKKALVEGIRQNMRRGSAT